MALFDPFGKFRKRFLILGGGSSFNPLSLSPSFLFDVGALAGLSDSDPVATLTDFSGNSKSGTATGAAQATYKTNALGSMPGLLFDGTGNYYTTPAIDLTGTAAITVIAVTAPEVTTAERFLLNIGSNPTRLFYYHSNTAGSQRGRYTMSVHGDVGYTYTSSKWKTLGTEAVVTSAWIDKSVNPDGVKSYLDSDRNVIGTTAVNNTNAFGNQAATIGAYGGANFFKGYLFHLAIIPRKLSDVEIQRYENYLYTRFSTWWTNDAGTNLHDNADSAVDVDGNYLRSFASRVVFDTEADTIAINWYAPVITASPAWAQLQISVDGVYHSTITASSAYEHTIVTGLGAGSKRVEITNGLRRLSGANIYGSYVQRVWGNAPISIFQYTPGTPTIVCYGDSITVGANCTLPIRDGWYAPVRAAQTDNVAVEAHGSRALYDDCQTEAQRIAFVSKLATAYPGMTAFVSLMGTNDYGLGYWGYADWAAAYADFCDRLHAALPAASIILITPILRESSAPDVLVDWRTAVNTFVALRPWITVIDGAAICTYPGDYDDTVHPNESGHAKIGAAANAAL